ncbi:spore protease YyaC [Salipaludibacillus sp. LMS25]|jgi:putative sporulation protein YyaC|uniref:spore protease YyaC n=1 Tax=Salipaludibacillus sp. LMS25 TaxID=2924031 RepID=UPI0020D0EDBE|nr:spore protease YyaC [Salipaludibacillus sp. LMS25]UTR16573.1 spore protease YyaC [Salipaludibacillus sp. LMS25]
MMVYGQFMKEKKYSSFRVHVDDPLATQELAKHIFNLLPESPEIPVVIVNIGSDRSTGDSLGPLTGTKLLAKRSPLYRVYGSLEAPVHAKNLEDTVTLIHETHHNPFIIAIDACLGKTENVGMLTVKEGPVMPGAAVKKKLPPVGTIHLTGIVNVGGYMELLVLQNTRLSLVMALADKLSTALWRAACWQANRQHVLYPSRNTL